MRKKNSAIYRKLIFSIVCIVLAFFCIFSVVSGYRRVQAQRASYAKLVAQKNKLKKERSSLETEVKNLDDDDYVVKYARDHYIFTQGSEKAVVLPDDDSD